MQDRGEHSETARLEAFSDGVFAIALTILVLRLPPLEMWINHHARMGLIGRTDGLLMFANGFVLFMVVALAFPTGLVGEYLTGPAAKGAVFTYALFVLGASGAWNVFMLAMKPERGLLRPGVPAKQIATTRKRVAIGFMIYLISAGLALVNAYLGLGLITAMWAFWGTVAYRALNEHRAWSTEA